MDKLKYTPENVKGEIPLLFAAARRARSLEQMRDRLSELIVQFEFNIFYDYTRFDEGSIIRVRDCAQALRSILRKRSDDLAGFSVAKAIRDVANDKARSELSTAFWADLLHLMRGVQGTGPGRSPEDRFLETTDLEGREAAVKRSGELDTLWKDKVSVDLKRYESGLSPDAVKRRKQRRERIMKALKASATAWHDYRWQLRNIARNLSDLEGLVTLSEDEKEAIGLAREHRLPFGVTPYYLSLMDDEPDGRDRSIRAQVFPPLSYVERMAKARAEGEQSLDFMLEGDTSPIELITRRYPAIAIFKPFNACPQICVYCQRNWEIEEPMGKGALATPDKMEDVFQWIEDHPALHEILVTGGDPFALGNSRLEKILKRLARIPSVNFIRIGTRTPVTVPMRVTDKLAEMLARLRKPGSRQVSVVTHVQHPYEITPELVEAVERLRMRGVPVYNQLVYTFFVSRRFEAAALRHQLRLAGIDPYYTFCAKGKEETHDYRVPLARILQEQKEEARMFPGLTRTDEAVFNVPGLGKNNLRASQHRDLISITPDGSRVYEFHPWEKNISADLSTYVGRDMPILEYLQRLEDIGEDPADYNTIWYYL
jgi:lysine 2,3-aminomutase